MQYWKVQPNEETRARSRQNKRITESRAKHLFFLDKGDSWPVHLGVRTVDKGTSIHSKLIFHGLIIIQTFPTRAEIKANPTHQITQTNTGAMFFVATELPMNPEMITNTSNNTDITLIDTTRVGDTRALPILHLNKFNRG